MPKHNDAQATPKQTRRNGTKTAQATPKMPINLRLPTDSLTRLKVHSLATGVPASDIVAKLIDANLTEYDLVPTRQDGRASRSQGTN